MHLGEVTSDLTEEFLFLFLIFILSKMKGIKTVVISSLSTQIDGCKCLTSTLSHSTKLYFFFASSDTPRYWFYHNSSNFFTSVSPILSYRGSLQGSRGPSTLSVILNTTPDCLTRWPSIIFTLKISKWKMVKRSQ